MSGYELDKYFPLQGTCFHCGRDMRHKILDSIIERFSAGADVNQLAAEHCVPPQAIELVIGKNSTTPIGAVFSPVAAARAKAA
jgi:hypothetical protein